MESFHVYLAVNTILRKSGFVSKKRDFVVIHAAEFSLFLFVWKSMDKLLQKSDRRNL